MIIAMASEWTPDTLKEHFDARFKATEDAVAAALAALKENKNQAMALLAVAVTIALASIGGLATLIFYLVTKHP